MWEDAAVELRGSKTEANLITAFSGESQATNKYTYYASKAKSEGYVLAPPRLVRKKPS